MYALGTKDGTSIAGNGPIAELEFFSVMRNYFDLYQDVKLEEGQILDHLYRDFDQPLSILLDAVEKAKPILLGESIRYFEYQMKSQNLTIRLDRLDSDHKQIMHLESIGEFVL